MLSTSTYHVLTERIRNVERDISELGRLASEAESRLALHEGKLEAASKDVATRAALVSEIAALDRETHKRHKRVSARKKKRARRARAAEKLAAMRSIESDVGLEDREAWALSEREMARARVRRATADLESHLRFWSLPEKIAYLSTDTINCKEVWHEHG